MNMMKISSLPIVGLVFLMYASTSCKESDLFNEEDYKHFVETSFPVEGIDPMQDWSTVQKYTLQVGIGYSDSYLLRVYTESPAYASSRLLNTSYVDGNKTYSISLTVPSIQKELFICLEDSKGNQRVKKVLLSDSLIDIVFSSSSAADESLYSSSDVFKTPMSYTFSYEDCFPQPGDCDFNDAVMDVSLDKTMDKSSGKRYIDVKVSLRAVGSFTRIAAAMRLSGIKSGQVATYDRSGDDFYFFGQYGDQDMLPKFGESNECMVMPKTDDIVIPVFNDAHYFISGGKTMSALPYRLYYNTKTDKKDQTATVTDAKSQTFRIEVKDETTFNDFSISDVDLFILEEYNASVFEVHTQPFKTAEVTREWAAKNADGISVYDNNYPWALMIPGRFRYPVEGYQIGIYKGDILAGAYLGFAYWARYRESNKDWYLNPQSSNMVYY